MNDSRCPHCKSGKDSFTRHEDGTTHRPCGHWVAVHPPLPKLTRWQREQAAENRRKIADAFTIDGRKFVLNLREEAPPPKLRALALDPKYGPALQALYQGRRISFDLAGEIRELAGLNPLIPDHLADPTPPPASYANGPRAVAWLRKAGYFEAASKHQGFSARLHDWGRGGRASADSFDQLLTYCGASLHEVPTEVWERPPALVSIAPRPVAPASEKAAA